MKAASTLLLAPFGYQSAKLYPPTPTEPRNLFFQEPKDVVVRLPRNRRKPRRGVFIQPLVPDVRGFHLRMARRVEKLIKAGVVQAEVRVPKQRPPVSKRQMLREWIEASVEDANLLARQRSDARLARQYENAVLGLKAGQAAAIVGRRVFVCEDVRLEVMS